MKVVVNDSWGGFGISNFALEKLGIKTPFKVERTDERLISLIEEFGSEKISDDFADLQIVEIPDDATDWRIENYDGCETVWYVQNGKMFCA